MDSADDEEIIEEYVHRASDAFGVLENAVRLKILLELEDERRNVTSIATALDRSQESISRHLKIMRLEDFLESKTEGRQRFYWIKKPELLDQCKKFMEILRRSDDS